MTADNLREGGHRGPSFSRRTFAKAAGVSAAALAIGASGASLAWFSGRDVKENKHSIAQNLNIRVVEPAWDPENAKSIVPNQHIPKDPRIENLSDEFSGWMVVEIRVPTAVVSIFDETEQKVLDPARTPLFSFVADPKWTLLQQFEDGDEDVYRFGWPETIPALGQTPPIFEEVVVANLAEAQGQSGSKTITATGYGIQSEGLPDIATAWDAYKKQNGIGDGEPDPVHAVTLLMSDNKTRELHFVRAKEAPKTGDSINSAKVTYVVNDVEKVSVGASVKSPLTNAHSSIARVKCDIDVQPANATSWFNGIEHCATMNLSGLDLSKSIGKTNMFAKCDDLEEIRINPNLNPSGSVIKGGLPAEFEPYPSDVYLLHRKYSTHLHIMEVDFFTHKELVVGRLPLNLKYDDMYTIVSHYRCESFETGGCIWPQGSTAVEDSTIIRFTENVKVKNCKDMFSGFAFVKEIVGLELVDTSDVSDFSNMFKAMLKLESLDISSFDLTKMSNASGMFSSLQALKSLDLTAFSNARSLNNLKSMFDGTTINKLDITPIDFNGVSTVERMFYGCNMLRTLTGIESIDASTIDNFNEMFRNTTNWTLKVAPSWDLSGWTVKPSAYHYEFCDVNNSYSGIKGQIVSPWD